MSATSTIDRTALSGDALSPEEMRAYSDVTIPDQVWLDYVTLRTLPPEAPVNVVHLRTLFHCNANTLKRRLANIERVGLLSREERGGSTVYVLYPVTAMAYTPDEADRFVQFWYEACKAFRGASSFVPDKDVELLRRHMQRCGLSHYDLLPKAVALLSNEFYGEAQGAVERCIQQYGYSIPTLLRNLANIQPYSASASEDWVVSAGYRGLDHWLAPAARARFQAVAARRAEAVAAADEGERLHKEEVARRYIKDDVLPDAGAVAASEWREP